MRNFGSRRSVVRGVAAAAAGIVAAAVVRAALRKRCAAGLVLALLAATLPLVRAQADPIPIDRVPIEPVRSTDVTPADAFWAPRLEANRLVTIPHLLAELEKQGSLGGFRILAGVSSEAYRGYMWGDSDVYKTIEGMARVLATHPDAAVAKRMEDLVASIVGAQAADGYLFPYLQLAEPGYRALSEEGTRTCESYSIGHLIECAVEHHSLTGSKRLLDVAVKAAALLARASAEGRLPVSGHPEIELALVKLHRATGDAKHLDLAARLIDGATRVTTLWSNGKPALGHDEAWGHVVAMLYLYSGAVDVAVLARDDALLDRMVRKWQDATGRKLYITGGLGHSLYSEGFGPAYELPNGAAYCETCAAIANVLWNQRLFLARGDGAFIDVLERSLYNNIIAGVSLAGDRFFYVNPLATDGRRKFNQGTAERFAWTGCPCCPVNIVRFLPQVPGFAYATRADEVFVNLFIAGTARVRLGENEVAITQKTAYPWEGRVELSISPDAPAAFVLRIRIPGWARGRPVPGDLYRYLEADAAPVSVAVNGLPAGTEPQDGFVRIARTWQRGDAVVVELPMPARRVTACEAVKDDAGRVAIERGPMVYCAEGVDNASHIRDRVLPDDASLSIQHRRDLLGGVTILQAEGRSLRRTSAGAVESRPETITLVPYCVWNHRGLGPMAVWLARDAEAAAPAPARTIASRSRVSTSYCHPGDTPDALNDQVEPRNSHDLEVPRLTWWDHRGTTEWAQYDFEAPAVVRGVAVYWFDDTGTGGCRVPARWSVQRKEVEAWKPVEGASAYGMKTDALNEVTFRPVATSALRMVVELAPGFSGGILEWRVLE
jgi:hypothetical protein